MQGNTSNRSAPKNLHLTYSLAVRKAKIETKIMEEARIIWYGYKKMQLLRTLEMEGTNCTR